MKGKVPHSFGNIAKASTSCGKASTSMFTAKGMKSRSASNIKLKK